MTFEQLAKKLSEDFYGPKGSSTATGRLLPRKKLLRKALADAGFPTDPDAVDQLGRMAERIAYETWFQSELKRLEPYVRRVARDVPWRDWVEEYGNEGKTYEDYLAYLLQAAQEDEQDAEEAYLREARLTLPPEKQIREGIADRHAVIDYLADRISEISGVKAHQSALSEAVYFEGNGAVVRIASHDNPDIAELRGLGRISKRKPDVYISVDNYSPYANYSVTSPSSIEELDRIAEEVGPLLIEPEDGYDDEENE